MIDADAAVREIETLVRELEQDGQTERAARLAESVSALLAQAPRKPTSTGELMTTGQAAEALGVRSVNTIKRWVSDGLLEGFQRGGRILVSKSSVDAVRDSGVVKARIDYDRRVDEALAAFGSDEEVDPSEMRAAWEGRKPWEPQTQGHA
jgi:excisionase family DNA binding protein